MIKEINHILFPQMTYLSLSGNKIESIEGISRIYMPQLEELGMSIIFHIQPTTGSYLRLICEKPNGRSSQFFTYVRCSEYLDNNNFS